MTAAPTAAPAAQSEPAILGAGIVKRFPGVLANDHVDFELRVGEVHALLGENGAGKSTLMNIFAGLYDADEGEMRVEGKPVAFRSPRDAIAAGIGMVHQHFALVPSQTVTENVILGLGRPRFRLKLDRFDDEIRDLAASVGLHVDPRARIWQLSVGEQQRVEILKLLYRGARILIMDEPTAVLAPQEIDELFATLRSMTAAGRSVVFISHKLGEVLAMMRRGHVTAAGIPAAGATKEDLAKLMVGRTVLERIHRVDREPGDVVLEASNVEALNDRGLPALRGASLQIRSGEIVGLAAVAGNGQAELAEALTGLRSCRGSIRLNGEEIANKSPGHAIKRGMGHIPEDRASVGSAPNLSIVDNAIMKRYRERPIAKGWVLDRVAARDLAERMTADYQISAAVDSDARLLSGGNLQRLILAREIERKPDLLVAVQPTRGLDVGAIETVHQLLLDRRAAGAAILLISEELDELLALADRIDVMYEGRIVGSFPPDAELINDIGLRMTSGAAAA